MRRRVAICGSREPSEWAREDVLAQIAALPADTIVISGRAPGIDTIAETAALARGLAFEPYPPDYTTYSFKAAPKVRNTQMAAICDDGIVYTAGSKGGSHDMIRQLRRFNKPFKEMCR